MIEIWKDVPGYEGRYQVSNLGRVKSVGRWVSNGKYQIWITEKILKCSKNGRGYSHVNFVLNNKRKSHVVHRLIMLAFVGPSDLQVDHINGIKTDNRLENLEYVTCRENTVRGHKKRKELPTGVSFAKNGYNSVISIKNTRYYLGQFKTIEDASAKYQAASNDLENIEKYISIRKVTKYGVGVYFNKNRFNAKVWIDKKLKHIGSFTNLEDARKCVLDFKAKQIL